MDNFDYNLFNIEKSDKDSSDKKDIYFSNVPTEQATNPTPNPTPNRRASNKAAKVKKAPNKSGVGSTYLFFVIVIAISMVLSIYAIFCMNDILAITKTQSSVTISFNEEIETASEAIDILADNDLITCKNFCKLFVSLRDSIFSRDIGGPYDPGMYYLNGKMGLEGMLLTLQGANQSSETVRLTFPEGYTVSQIVEKLSANDVCDKASLLSVIESTEYSYSLVSDLKAEENVPYRLEGYLFPDTYEFYIGESASSVVRRFLDVGEQKFTAEYRTQAEALGLTTDEIMVIASIIQKEAADETQMKVISSVIHNRLKDTVNFPTLGCDSTADYITNRVAPYLSSTSAHTADYYMEHYNTYMIKGLPPSPICNPGAAAIEAALYPEDTSYLYFFHDTKGNMYTSKTLQEHKNQQQKYAPYLLY